VDWSRVVDVSARKPAGGFTFGSGYLIAPGLVLTARHVTCADSGEPYGDVGVRFLADGSPLPCQVAWQGGPDLDAALLRCAPREQQDMPVRWGRLIASEPGVACEAAGFPRSMRQDDGLRDVEHMHGAINPGTGLLGGRIYVDIASAFPQPGGWDGMSGAALWCGPLLVGIVVHDPAAFASRRLAAEPAGRLAADPGFEAIVGGKVAVEAAELARPAPEVRARGPAFLLRAEARTVRFRSRTGELARLAAWCQGPGVRVHLLTGPGGQGKTRLADELASRLGWVSAWLDDETGLPAGIRDPLLVIMDYAEMRPEQVARVILAALAEPGHVPIRVLLLARSAGDWWQRLRNQAAELDMGLAGAAISELAVLEGSPEGRRRAFSDALADYDAALTAMTLPHTTPGEVAPPDFADPRLGSALQLQMTALAGLLGKNRPDESPEDVILRHESRYWMRTAVQHRLTLHEDTQRNAVTAAVLCGAATQPQAIDLLGRVPGLRDQSEDTRLRAARWLRDLYPAPSGPAGQTDPRTGHGPFWGTLAPDLLTEHLVACVAEELPGFLASLLAATSADQDHQALTVLARASLARENLSSAIAGLLLDLPKLAVRAVEVATQAEDPAPLLAALNNLVMRGAVSTGLLTEISRAIPGSTRALASFAVTVEQMLVADYQADGTSDGYPVALAPAWAELAHRLAQAGRPQEALAASERAVAMLEQLAEADPRMLPRLAVSMHYLGGQLLGMHRGEEAIAALRRAVDIREHLPDADSTAMQLDLAGSVGGLAAALTVTGHERDAPEQFQRAVMIFEQLAEADINVDDRLSGMALTLANQAQFLADAGSGHQALAAARRAVDSYERLAEDRPDAWLPSLANSLTTLSSCLAGAGRYGDAVATGERAVDIWQQLAESLPDAHRPGLAIALRSLSKMLADTGNRDQALAVSRRAAAIHQELAASSPDAYLPELASSLNSLAGDLHEAGQAGDALDVSRGAIAIYDRITGAEPAVHRPGLGMSLLTLTAILDAAGQAEEALVASERAVTVYQQLAQSGLAAHRTGWAGALNNHAVLQGDLGRHEDALATAQRAVSISEQLAVEFPGMFLPDLAMPLATLASQLRRSGRLADAVAASERAVELYERETARHDGHLPNLALSLRNLSIYYGDAARPDDAITAIQRAVGLYDRLADDDPRRYLPALARALDTFSDQLAATGRIEPAVEASERAVSIYGTLAADDPQQHAPGLAGALQALADRLSDAEQRERELEVLQRAVSLHDTLGAEDPAAYLPTLARLLNNLSTRLDEAKRYRESAAAAEQAVGICERLAESDPDTHLPRLASFLRGMSLSLAHAGRVAEAVDAGQRSVDTFTMLAGADPDTYLGELARSLNSLSVRLAAMGRDQQAVEASKQAVEIDQRLEATSPGAHLPHLARVLTTLSAHLLAVGRRDEAVAAAREAVSAFTQLTEAGEVSYLPYLATALRNLKLMAVTPAHNAEYLAAAHTAIGTYQRLTPPGAGSGSAAQTLAAELSDQLLNLDRPPDAVAQHPAAAGRPDRSDTSAPAPRHLLVVGSGEMMSRTIAMPYPGRAALQPLLLLESPDRAWTVDEHGTRAELGVGSLVNLGMTQLRAGNLIPGPARGWKLLLHAETARLVTPDGWAFYDGDCDQHPQWRILVRNVGSCLVLAGQVGICSQHGDFSSIAGIRAMLDRAARAGLLAGGLVAVEWPPPATLSSVSADPGRGAGLDQARTQAPASTGNPLGERPQPEAESTRNDAQAIAALRLGDRLAEHGDVEGARAAYQQAIDSGHPDAGPVAAANLGVLLAEHGDVESARAAYQQAIDSGHLDAGSGAAYNLGILLEAHGDPDGARGAYQHAIDSGHADHAPAAAFNLGVLLEEHEDADRALRAYRQAAESGHRKWAPGAAVNLGALLAQRGDRDGARTAYQQAIDSGHRESAPRALTNLASLLEEEGNADAAQAAYRRAIASGQPDTYPNAAFHLGRLLMKQGSTGLARAAFEQAIDSMHPHWSPGAAFYLGLMLVRAGELDGAEAAYQQAINSRHSGASSAAAVNLGRLLAARGDAEGAREAYQFAINSGHHDYAPEAAHSLGLLLAGQDDIEGAKAAYQQAINSRHPDAGPKAAVSLGLLLARHDAGGARAAYQIAINSGHPTAGPAAAIEIRRLSAE